eukprot:scaffold6420_cov53-Phaeocystis_antarctica.AAC.4
MAAIFMTSLVSPVAGSEAPTHSVPTYPSLSYVEPDGQHIRSAQILDARTLAPISRGCCSARMGKPPSRPPPGPNCSTVENLLGPGGEEGGGLAHAAFQPSGVKPLR